MIWSGQIGNELKSSKAGNTKYVATLYHGCNLSLLMHKPKIFWPDHQPLRGRSSEIRKFNFLLIYFNKSPPGVDQYSQDWMWKLCHHRPSLGFFWSQKNIYSFTTKFFLDNKEEEEEDRDKWDDTPDVGARGEKILRIHFIFLLSP